MNHEPSAPELAPAPVVGLLHPGSMGAAVAAQLRRDGVRVLWLPAGRSPASAARAERAGIEPAADLEELVAASDVVLSLCPPAAAVDVARRVADCGLGHRTFVEANAVSPQTMERIHRILGEEAELVDGAVVGSPPVGGKRPRLYVAGPARATARLARLFAATDVEVHLLGEGIGSASALKLAYTSYQKASRVLAAVAYGLADAHGVTDELLDIAAKRPGSYLSEPDYIPKTAARAWRWGPELEEAAESLQAEGLPSELLSAAAAVLARWADARDAEMTPLDALGRLRQEPDGHS